VKDNPVSEALRMLSLHTLDLQLRSNALGDAEAEFVWHEVREMLRSLAMLKRSPLLDELNGRISKKPNGSDYYYARIAATAAVFMVMRAQSWPRARACKAVGRLTGVSADILEKKMGLPTDPHDLSKYAVWEYGQEVSFILGCAKSYATLTLGREPTRKEWFKAIIRLSKSNVQSSEQIGRRHDVIRKALNAKVREETRQRHMLHFLDMIERLSAEP
jgi:hypothetical protein